MLDGVSFQILCDDDNFGLVASFSLAEIDRVVFRVT